MVLRKPLVTLALAGGAFGLSMGIGYAVASAATGGSTSTGTQLRPPCPRPRPRPRASPSVIVIAVASPSDYGAEERGIHAPLSERAGNRKGPSRGRPRRPDHRLTVP